MTKEPIVGRKREVAILNKLWRSKESEFVAVYGRRRVGKTHLIREYFSDKAVYFELTGIKDAKLAVQLEVFQKSLVRCFTTDCQSASLEIGLMPFPYLLKRYRMYLNPKKSFSFLTSFPGWRAAVQESHRL